MNTKTIALILLLVSIVLVGCEPSTKLDTYATYNQPQQQNQYVGGGCGVAGDSAYTEPMQEQVSAVL